MKDKDILTFDLIHCKIAYIIASLASYSSLDLSKRIIKTNEDIDLIKKSIIDNKDYIDIRDVVSFRKDLESLKGRLTDDKDVPLEGHKIACLLFEASTMIKMLLLDIDSIDDDKKEYLMLASNYLYICGKIINVEILCY